MKRGTERNMLVLMVAGLIIYGVLTAFFGYSFDQGPNNRNVSVDTRVNISESLPEVLQVLINDGASNITLVAGWNVTVNCSVQVRDYNGGNSIDNVSATFYHQATSSDTAPDDNNGHYTNSSCAIDGTDGFFRNFTCQFDVTYYANASIWVCNATVTDDFDFNDSRFAYGSNTTHIDALNALNVTTLIDYGDLAVGDTSTPQIANITNIGNVDINISVYGYGGAMGDGLSFNCTQGNISIQYEKYNITDQGQDVTRYYNLSSSPASVPGLTVNQQVDDTQQVINRTYWALYVPPNPFGTCNGTVVFQAEAAS